MRDFRGVGVQGKPRRSSPRRSGGLRNFAEFCPARRSKHSRRRKRSARPPVGRPHNTPRIATNSKELRLCAKPALSKKEPGSLRSSNDPAHTSRSAVYRRSVQRPAKAMADHGAAATVSPHSGTAIFGRPPAAIGGVHSSGVPQMAAMTQPTSVVLLAPSTRRAKRDVQHRSATE